MRYPSQKLLSIDSIIRSLSLIRTLLVIVLVAVESGFSVASVTSEPPNVLIFIVDDLGIDDLGASGNPDVSTPQIDRLSRESIRFKNYYVTPLCATTRASLLTGLHHWRVGVTHVHGGGDYMDEKAPTLGTAFQKAGYRTAFWGKWHSGKNPGFFPWNRGFEEAYYSELYKHEKARGWKNNTYVEKEQWSPARLKEFATSFLRKQDGRPFMAVVSYLAVHEPMYAPEELIAKYANAGFGEHTAHLYAMVESIDASVGAILNCLEAEEQDLNTIVVFMSDNGPTTWNTSGIGHWPEDQWKMRNRFHRLRGKKEQIWENGVRSPLYIRWPREITAKSLDTISHVTDIMPTLLSLTGIDPNYQLSDGVDLSPNIKGTKTSEKNDRIIFGSHPRPIEPGKDPMSYNPVAPASLRRYPFENQQLYVRTQRFKLLLNPPGIPAAELADSRGFFLVDINADPHEQHNVWRQHPNVSARLEASMRKTYEDMITLPNAFPRPTFRIGIPKQAQTRVRAFAPYFLLGDANNTAHYLQSLKKEGDGGVWRLKVVTAGTYEIEIEQNEDLASGISLEITIGNQSKQIELGSGHFLPLGKFHLPSGPLEMRIEVKSAPPSAQLNRIRHLIFRKIGHPINTSPRPW